MKKSWRILFICVIAALLAVGGGSSDDTTQGVSMPTFLRLIITANHILP